MQDYKINISLSVVVTAAELNNAAKNYIKVLVQEVLAEREEIKEVQAKIMYVEKRR